MTVRRTGFLVTPADTLTVYAAQGSTFDAVIADMQRPPNYELTKHWPACYVMLSRATSADGFLILRPATRKELSARPPQYLIDEIDRLLRQEAASLPKLLDYINSLPLEIPPQISQRLGRTAEKEQEALVAQHRASIAPTAGGVARSNASEAPRAQRVPKAPIGGEIRKVNASEPPPVSPPQRPTHRCRKKTRPENATRTSSMGSDVASAALAALALCGASLTSAAIASPPVREKRKLEHRKEVAGVSLSETQEPFIQEALEPQPFPEPEVGSEMECESPHEAEDETAYLAQASALGQEADEEPPPKLRRVHEHTSNDDQTCSVDANVRYKDALQGCSSCHRSCDVDCSSNLCPWQPCECCLSFHVATHFDSEVCIDLQRDSGCHAC